MFGMLNEMFSFFYPDEYHNSVVDIDYDKIYAKGIRGLIFDIDNTVAPYNTFEISGQITDLFKRLLLKGFSICFLSNNKKKRVEHFCDMLDVRGFHTALKPIPFGMAKAIRYLDMPRESLAIIGDQIFTDVLCGRWQKIYTILVDPIVPQTDWLNKFKRKLEIVILSKYGEAMNKKS